MVRTVMLSALVLALAGFRVVLPVDRLATVFVVDLSDSVGNDGREDALAFLRETLDVMPDGDVAGIVAFGKDALVERLPSDLAEIDRIASTPVRSATRHRRARSASRPPCSRTTPRSGSCCCPTATTRPARGQAEAALAATRDIRIETRLIGLGETDEVLVERVTTPSTSNLGESIEVVADIRSSVRQPATVRLFADGTLSQDDPRSRSRTGSRGSPSTSRRPRPAFHTFRVVVEAARDTFSQNDRARREHDRQGRATDARRGRATRSSRKSSWRR